MKVLRKILFPFSGLYYIITSLRNKAYNLGCLSSQEYELPIINVGNLNTGGTGKSPMTEYLVLLLKDQYKIATLSRGYGRKTNGYLNVSSTSLAENVGDEPLQFAKKFDDVAIAVCEDRRVGISKLLKEFSSLEAIILDDAYQHRRVKAGFQIVLTTYNDLYSNDYLLPVGNLREPRNGIQRANVIIVTKCPKRLSKVDREVIIKELKPLHQKVYFTTITYNDVVVSNTNELQIHELKSRKVTLVTGIANPKPLVGYLQNLGIDFEHKLYKDHHNFALSEIEELESCECIVTTEKDYVRLSPLLKNKELYYLSIKASFLFDGNLFDKQILEFVRSF